ncbi:hypothetical protein TVAG_216340 [Trichomonas vaginalis G3]|uniref:Uncharacterized protein n=1 Tax=Trichomonas vaginalis (strain ATCC PRA-98 / G3) TaxID=412133 RepID=A2ENW8_TRIV3|nr:hypothetical protein TVAGG3_0249510 [Trichomonas vaginalis G3]EAY05658.1 hypothetical protein TVAG_216340 [Trichomonas vaginalis G3]KAI5553898.1 hypothetical protein TVAGG3_0249510 [Trichomonas vaginalis G3]|eukprot:XP_001317881.1 hypothetical protein [Trichomonas vaginalis G3]
MVKVDLPLEEKFDGELLQTTEWKKPGTTDEDDEAPKKVWNKVFGIFVAISIGVFAGMSCKTIGESFLYSALFLGECFICVCISGIVKTLSFKSSVISFAIYFGICGIVTPISSWGGSKLI